MGRKNLSATSRKAAVNARKSPANKTPKGSGKKKSAKKKKSSSEEEEEEEEEEEDEADEEEGKKTSKIQYTYLLVCHVPVQTCMYVSIKNPGNR